jgi:hypothetical protein
MVDIAFAVFDQQSIRQTSSCGRTASNARLGVVTVHTEEQFKKSADQRATTGCSKANERKKARNVRC